MTFSFAAVNGTQIHYELRGEGTAVTLIHAGIANLHMWDDQVEALAQDYQVLRYDVRGWGQTPGPEGPFSHHEDLRALLAHLGIEKTAVVGCSWGGKIGLDFALTYPEMMTGLVLVGPGLGGYEWSFADFAEKAEAIGAAYEQGDKAAAAELQTQIWFDGPERTPAQVKSDIRRRAYEMALHTLELPEGSGTEIELDPPAIDRLAEIRVPAHIIVGQYDVPDIHTIAQRLEAALPLAEEMTIMRNTAHLPNMERPSTFNRLVLEFLERIGWQSTVYAILPHETEAQVWLQQTAAGFALPHLQITGGLWDTTIAQVQRPWQQQFGPHVQGLYRAYFQQDETAKTTESVIVLDNLGLRNGENGRWASESECQTLPLANPAHRPLISRCLQEWETGDVPATRPLWARRGWFAGAKAWTETELGRQGRAVTELTLLRNWPLSYLMRIQTDKDTVYFKAVADLPLFVNEAQVVATLAALFPEHLLTPLAIDAGRDWLLLPAVDEIVGWGGKLAQRQGFLRQFARLQTTAVAHVPQLLAAGCLDRRPAVLAGQIIPLLEAVLPQTDLSDDEKEQLWALVPRLQAICHELAAEAVPATLLHGDLHGGNVGLRDGAFVYFDWTDACISHPFFDVLPYYFEEDTAVQTELRNAYLAPWGERVPMPHLLKIWALAEVGAALHHAVSYWQIAANIEPFAGNDLGEMIPFWLRKVLAAHKTLEAAHGS